MLALKEFFGKGFRDVVAWIENWSELREVLGLEEVPHFSTLCYAEKRLLKKGALPGSLMSASVSPSAAA